MTRNYFFSIGADPEIFIQNSKDKYISAVGMIGGTKHHPKPIDLEGNCIQEDNVAIEFNTAVAQDFLSFKKAIKRNLSYIQTQLPHFKISKESAISFPKDQLNTAEANVFGCEPDYNAWLGKRNPKPFSTDECLRSAGGHIHIGCDIAKEAPEKLIQACDLFLGVPSILLDNNTVRRELYGKAGAYRIKPFGVEYRTLSNFWIFEDHLIEWVYSQVATAINFVATGKTISNPYKEIIINCINNSQKDTARLLLQRFNINA